MISIDRLLFSKMSNANTPADIEDQLPILNTTEKLETNESFKLNFNLKEKFYSTIRKHLWLFPLFSAILIPLLCVTTYISALLHNHIEPVFPYISDAGAIGPQAGVFSQMLDTISILILISTFIRYKQLKYLIKVKLIELKDETKQIVDYDSIRHLCEVAFRLLLIASIGCLTIFVPANFRDSEWIHLHCFGAGVGFVALYICAGLMIYICNRLAAYGIESRPITLTVFTVVGSLSVVVSSVCTGMSLIITNGKMYDIEYRLKWNSQQEGYWWHVASSVAEWMLVNMYSLIMLCVARRMKLFDQWHQVTFSH